MINDEQLLQQYAHEDSESAFGELVTRHIDFVHSAALRVVNGDSHLAQDVTQTVFIDLARKAGNLPRSVVLAGWLHRHTCYAAATAVRTERRRHTREQTAMEMRALDDNTRPPWELVAPYLDEGLNQLNPADRDALVLRFLKRQDLRTVGEALGISEDAAQKRVDRALEKLHVFLKQRGATLTVAALGTAVTTEAVTTAPAGLAAAITATALAGKVTATTTATHTILTTMFNAKAIIATVGAAALVGTGTYLVQQRQVEELRAENQNLLAQRQQLIADQKAAAKAAQSTKEQLARVQQDNTELLRLRNEVGQLRQAAKQRPSEAAAAPTSTGRSAANPGPVNPLPFTTELFTRMMLVQNAENLKQGKGLDPKQPLQQLLLDYLKQNGVELQLPAYAKFDEDTQFLTIHASVADLDKVQILLPKLRDKP